MAFTDNQINDAFQSALGRPATDYEIKQYQKASPQTLANLKGDYGKLNVATSINDYLKSQGIDPNTRSNLASQYGISNIGTAEGNVALLNALRSGKTTEQPAVGGSLIPPPQEPTKPSDADIMSGSVSAASALNAQTPPPTPLTPEQQQAALTPPKTTDTTPDINTDPYVKEARANVNSAYSVQQQTQQAVFGLDKQIADINNAISSALDNKRKEVAASGGVVDESQLRSLVTAENAPLLQERANLMSNRASYVSAYTSANQAYQKALADRRDAESSFINQQKLSLTAQKQAEVEKQNDIRNQQFEAKLNQSGIKYLKYTNPEDNSIIYQEVVNGVGAGFYKLDDNGNPVSISGVPNAVPTGPVTFSPGSSAAVNNPLGIKPGGKFAEYSTMQEGFQAGADLIKRYQTTGVAGVTGNSTLEQFVNTWINGTKDRKAGQGYTADDIAKDLGVTKDTKIGTLNTNDLATSVANHESPGWNSPSATVAPKIKGVFGGFNTNDASLPESSIATTPIKELDNRTPTAIIQNSIAYALQGGNLQQFVGGLSAKDPKTQAIKNAIDNKASALAAAAGTDLSTLRNHYAADKKIASTLAPRYAFTAAAANTAQDNMDLALKQSPNVGRTDSAFINNILQKYQKDFTQAKELTKFEVYIYTASREYAKVTSGSSQSVAGLTDSATKAAELLLAAKQSPAALASAIQAMQDDMDNVKNRLNEQIGAQSSFQDIRDFMALIHPTAQTAAPQTFSTLQDAYNSLNLDVPYSEAVKKLGGDVSKLRKALENQGITIK